MPAKRLGRWPHLLILIGLFFIGLTGWSVYRSVTGVSAVTDRHYYDHGLKYNDTLIEQRAAESQEWLVSISMRDGSLACRLTGRDGDPVRGGEARLDIDAEYAGGITLPLTERSAGHYATPLPTGLKGEIPARLTFRQGGTTLRRSLRLNL